MLHSSSCLTVFPPNDKIKLLLSYIEGEQHYVLMRETSISAICLLGLEDLVSRDTREVLIDLGTNGSYNIVFLQVTSLLHFLEASANNSNNSLVDPTTILTLLQTALLMAKQAVVALPQPFWDLMKEMLIVLPLSDVVTLFNSLVQEGTISPLFEYLKDMMLFDPTTWSQPIITRLSKEAIVTLLKSNWISATEDEILDSLFFRSDTKDFISYIRADSLSTKALGTHWHYFPDSMLVKALKDRIKEEDLSIRQPSRCSFPASLSMEDEDRLVFLTPRIKRFIWNCGLSSTWSRMTTISEAALQAASGTEILFIIVPKVKCHFEIVMIKMANITVRNGVLFPGPNTQMRSFVPGRESFAILKELSGKEEKFSMEHGTDTGVPTPGAFLVIWKAELQIFIDMPNAKVLIKKKDRADLSFDGDFCGFYKSK